jgi:hypothetical protein
MNGTPRASAEPSVDERASRRRVAIRRGVTLLIAASLLLGLFAVIPTHIKVSSGLADAAGSASFTVSAEQGYSFTPSGISNVATNTSVNVTAINADPSGTLHTFWIWNVQGRVIPTGTDVDSLMCNGHCTLLQINFTSMGQTVHTNFTAPSVGWYEFVCGEPGHFEQGMYGFIAFGEPLPANLSATAPSDGPGAAVFIIIGTIVALVVIALVLGFVVGRRRGSVYEMPPERLGYPEPEPPPAPGAPPKMPPAPPG